MENSNSVNRLYAEFKSYSDDFAAWTDLTLCFDENEVRWEVFDAIAFLFEMYRQNQNMQKKKAGKRQETYSIFAESKPRDGAWRIRISQYTGYGKDQDFVKTVLDTIIGLDSFDKIWDLITGAYDIKLSKDDDDAKELAEIIQSILGTYEEMKNVLLSYKHDVFEECGYFRTEHCV